MHHNSDDRELLQKMKNLLLSGARMLDESCPNCGTPLFYIKEVGLKYCPKCDIYVATLREIENAKIDKHRLKLINIDELKEVSISEKEKTSLMEKNKAKMSKTINEKISDAINELILVIIEKLILLLEKDYEKMGVDSLLRVLENAIKIIKEVKN